MCESNFRRHTILQLTKVQSVFSAQLHSHEIGICDVCSYHADFHKLDLQSETATSSAVFSMKVNSANKNHGA